MLLASSSGGRLGAVSGTGTHKSGWWPGVFLLKLNKGEEEQEEVLTNAGGFNTFDQAAPTRLAFGWHLAVRLNPRYSQESEK